MSILQIISRNFIRGSRTRKPDDVVPFPAGFRGVLTHEVTLCVGCKTCAYVCSPSAITFDERDTQFIVWNYFAGQCTFCARCVDYCPTKAIQLQDCSPAIAAHATPQRIAHQVLYQTCPACGRPVIPLPQPTLEQLYPQGVTPQAIADQKLCSECRRRTTSERIRDGVLGS